MLDLACYKKNLFHKYSHPNLLNSQSGIIAGASYTDINARLPGLQVLVVITIFGSLLLLLNAFWVRGVRIILGSFILWVAAFLLLGTVFPSIIQREYAGITQ